MVATPHPDSAVTINCAIVTVSDTRTVETDRSGQLIRQLLTDAGHQVVAYVIVKDEPLQIRAALEQFSQQADLAAVMINGGTGIAPRDTTYDAIAALLEKTLPGFGELFRWLSYQDIGSRAMASRAIAGVFRAKLVFSIPGSTGAVTLAMQTLILPELRHLVSQINTAH
ncbi:MAG: molybdenum cofactor biosynthesis protein B [Stenomitos frigidus ULC029]